MIIFLHLIVFFILVKVRRENGTISRSDIIQDEQSRTPKKSIEKTYQTLKYLEKY